MGGLQVLLPALLVAAAAAEVAEHEAIKRAGISPVEKVINLLEKLLKESEDEGMKEAAGYDKYACFCKAQADAKILAINKDIAKTEILTARIEKLGSEINSLNVDIGETQVEVAAVEKTMAEEKAARAKAHNEFAIKLADFQEAIRGASDAIDMMQGSGGSPLLLLQGEGGARVGKKLEQALRHAVAHGFVSASTGEQAQNVMSLLEFLTSEAPPAFEYHSKGIIDVLTGVLKEFKEKKNELESEEASKKFEFDSAQLARSHQRQSMMENIAKNEQLVSQDEDQKAADEADKEQTITNQGMDQTFLDELIKQCEDMAKAWDQRSKTRANELMALTEATEIMKGKVAASYGANKKLNLVGEKQVVKKGVLTTGHWVWVPSFLQTGRTASGGEQKVIEYLDEQAKRLRSPVLAAIALKAKAGEDHFAKVRTMIKDMIAKLEADAEAEQSQKGWCDEQMAKAMEKRDENIGGIEGDFASITESKARIATLKEEVETVTKDIADLYKAMNEQTALRKEESAENATTLKDAKAGLNAVKAATQVLKDFYESNALVQFVPEKAGADGKTVGDMVPKTGFGPGGDYKGGQDSAKGIIGLMEVITSDFEGTITATEDAETTAQGEYDTYKTETNDSITQKKDAMRTAKANGKDTDATLFDLKDDLKEHTDLKNEALSELSKLKPTCVGTGANYEERVARREQEIASLKNAIMLLSEMTFLQK